MENNYKFHMQEEFYTDRINIWIEERVDGKRLVGTLTFKEVEKHLLTEPTLSVPLESTFPDQMKQALKAMGRLQFANEETLKSKDYHLEDMRRLVFGEKK